MLNFKLAASRFVNVSMKEINVIEENTMPKSKKGAHKFDTMHQYEFFAVKFQWKLTAYLRVCKVLTKKRNRRTLRVRVLLTKQSNEKESSESACFLRDNRKRIP